MTTGIIVPGWPTSDRIPRVVFSLAFGQGNKGNLALMDYALFVGARAYDATSPTPVAVGTAVDATPYPFSSAAEAAALWGDGSDIHRQALAYFAQYPGAPAYGVSWAKGSGSPARGTLACILSTPPSVAGTPYCEIAGTRCYVDVTASEAIDDIGADFAAAINANSDLPVLAAWDAGTDTVTLIAKCYGAQSNAIRVLWGDLPASLAVTNSDAALATGADGTSPGWSAAYAAAFALDTVFYHVFPATGTLATINSGTGNLKGRIVDGLAPTVGRLMDAWVGAVTTLSAAQTINDGLDSGTRLYNEPGYWFRLAWAKNNQVEPWVHAADVGGLAALNEAVSPAFNWIGLEGGPVLKSTPIGPVISTDFPTDTELSEAIAYGICPTQYYHRQGISKLVTSVTSKHLIGAAANPSYVEHTNVTAIARAVSYSIRAGLASEFSGYNVTDNGEDGKAPDKLPGGKTTCPYYVRASLLRRMREFEKAGWVQNVTEHEGETAAERDATLSGRINYELPIDATRWTDAIGGNHREVGR